MSDPTELGPFKINRLIGRGGMGAVYEARHEETDTTVAVKVLLEPMEEESELRSRFEAEIETLKRLRHPNIVRLFGFGQEEGLLYYAMEYVQGPSLQDLLRQKRFFTWEEVVHIGISVAKALRHAHDRGIIHRDIKPANILLMDDGQVKVSDYGIAHFFGSSRLTDANMVIGTIEYMAPEQASAGPLTPKSDIYSLGALLYVLITGTPPYNARTLPEILRKYKSGPPESVRYKRPEVPAVLDLFIMELLRPQPEKRPANATLIQRRLEAIRVAFSKNTGQTNPFLTPRKDERSDYYEFLKEVEVSEAAAGASDRFRVNLAEPSGIFLPQADDPAASAEPQVPSDSAAPRSTSSSVPPSGDEFDFDLNPGSRPMTVTPAEGFSADSSRPVAVTEIYRSGAEGADQQNADFDLNEATGLSWDPPPSDSVRSAKEKPRGNVSGAGFSLKTPDGLASSNCSDAETVETLRLKKSTDIDSSEKKSAEEPLSPKTIVPKVPSAKEGATAYSGLNTFNFDLSPDIEDDEVSPTVLPSGRAGTLAAEEKKPDSLAIPDSLPSAAPSVGGADEFPSRSAGRRFPFSARLSSGSKKRVTSDSDLMAEKAKTLSTPLSTSTRASHFTMVSEEELGRIHVEAEEPSPYVSVKIWVFSGILLIFGVLFWYSLRSPSADQIYRKIRSRVDTAADQGEYLGALRASDKEIGQFLSLYPSDRRADQVREYSGDLELGNLERRLERQIERRTKDSSLSAIEYAYIEAIQAVKRDPSEGIEKLQAFIDLFSSDSYQTEDEEESADGNEERPKQQKKRTSIVGVEQTIPGQCVVLAQRRLVKIREVFEKNLKLQTELIESRLDLADSLDITDPERAERIRRSIIAFYGDKSWANAIVERSENALKNAASPAETPENVPAE